MTQYWHCYLFLDPHQEGSQNSICKSQWPKKYIYVCVDIYLYYIVTYMNKFEIIYLNIPYLRDLRVTDDMMISIMTSWHFITEQYMSKMNE